MPNFNPESRKVMHLMGNSLLHPLGVKNGNIHLLSIAHAFMPDHCLWLINSPLADEYCRGSGFFKAFLNYWCRVDRCYLVPLNHTPWTLCVFPPLWWRACSPESHRLMGCIYDILVIFPDNCDLNFCFWPCYCLCCRWIVAEQTWGFHWSFIVGADICFNKVYSPDIWQKH